MEKIIKFIVRGIFIVGLILLGLYFGFIYLMGHNFVHEGSVNPEYYDNITNRIYFTTKYRGEEFNPLLDSFLKINPKFVFSDTTIIEVNEDNKDSSASESFPFTKTIYFNSFPIEAYRINYGLDSMYADGAGVIDIIFRDNNNKWTSVKSSKLDSTEKNRIKTRFVTSVLEKLK